MRSLKFDFSRILKNDITYSVVRAEVLLTGRLVRLSYYEAPSGAP